MNNFDRTDVYRGVSWSQRVRPHFVTSYLENGRLSFPRASYLRYQNKNELPDTFLIPFRWIDCNK